MALVTGLTILFQIRFDLPPDHLTLILRSFAVLWLLGSVIFPSGLVGTHKLEVEFSRHVGRLTFMCLSLLVLYALYLMLLPGHGTSLHTCPPPSAVTSPPPLAVTPSREVQSNLGFFIALGVLEIIRHIAFWVMVMLSYSHIFLVVFLNFSFMKFCCVDMFFFNTGWC